MGDVFYIDSFLDQSVTCSSTISMMKMGWVIPYGREAFLKSTMYYYILSECLIRNKLLFSRLFIKSGRYCELHPTVRLSDCPSVHHASFSYTTWRNSNKLSASPIPELNLIGNHPRYVSAALSLYTDFFLKYFIINVHCALAEILRRRLFKS